MDFQDLLAQNGGFGGKIGKGWYDVDLNELILNFEGCYLRQVGYVIVVVCLFVCLFVKVANKQTDKQRRLHILLGGGNNHQK